MVQPHNFWMLCTRVICPQEHATFVGWQACFRGSRLQAILPSLQECTQCWAKRAPFVFPVCLSPSPLAQHLVGEGCTPVRPLVTSCNPVGWAITSLFSYTPGEDEEKRERAQHTHMYAGGDCMRVGIVQ